MNRTAVHPVQVAEAWEPREDVTQLKDKPGGAENPSTEVGPSSQEGVKQPPTEVVLSRPARIITWLLRLTGHSGGPGCLSWLCATLLYLVLTSVLLSVVLTKSIIGTIDLAKNRGGFSTAFSTSFFGITDALMWATLTCTFLVGRRRYANLLPEVKQALKEAREAAGLQPPSASDSGQLSRRTAVLLATTVAILMFLESIYIYMFLTGPVLSCVSLTSHCAQAVMRHAVLFVVLDCSLFLIPIKLQFAGEFTREGFRLVHAELKAMMDEGYINPAKLEQLGRCQCRLSASLCQLTAGMTPELASCMFFGIIQLVSGILMVIDALRSGTVLLKLPEIVIGLCNALVTVVVPCEAGQMLLDRVAQIRDTLLDRPAGLDLATSHQLLLQLEATRRDLDGIGDLSLYRLRRATVLSIGTVVLTYIIVFLQFQQPEGNTGGN